MSVEVETRSRAGFFNRGLRSLLSANRTQRTSEVLAVVSTVPTPVASAVSPVHAMFQDARNTTIRHATFNIYGSGPASSAPSSPESGNPQQPSSRPHTTEITNDMSTSANSVLPASPIPAPQTSPEIYVHHLMTKDRGYPLWIPSPNMRLPASYRASGVRIGDVGIITQEGSFSFLFNIFHEATHPINASMRLPRDFLPFTHYWEISPSDVDEFKVYCSGSYLSGGSLERKDEGDNRLKTTLKTSAANAAVLMMPEPVYASKLKSTFHLRKYVRFNIKSWYRFLRTVLGHEVGNGDLRVVYGCKKSAAFGMATVLNSGSADASTELTFSVDDSWAEVTGCKYHWHHKGSAEVKAGPSFDENRDVQNMLDITTASEQPDPVINQCLFVDTIDFTLPENEWEHIDCDDPVPATTSTKCPGSPSESSLFTQSASASGCLSNSSHSGVSQSPCATGIGTLLRHNTYTVTDVYDESEFWPSIPPSKRLFHPSDVLAQFLLQMIPQVSSVALCSDDWGPYMTDSVLTVGELIDYVLSANDICEDDGMVYLNPKSHALSMDYLESTSPLVVQQPLAARYAPHNLSLTAAPVPQNFVAMYLATGHSVRHRLTLLKTPPLTARPCCITVRFLDLIALLTRPSTSLVYSWIASEFQIVFPKRYGRRYNCNENREYFVLLDLTVGESSYARNITSQRGDHSHEFSKSSITRASLSDFLHNRLYQVWAGDDGGPEGNDSLESPKLYKCMQCPDFDFCEACEKDYVYQHPDHRFMQIKTSQHTFNSDGSTSTSTNANLDISERVASPVPSSSRAGGVERQGVPLPQRNRYSSTFGHRYTGSVWITTSIPASTSGMSAGAPGSGGGDSGQGNAITLEGRAALESTSSTRDWSLGRSQDRKFKSASYLNTNKDDDDISIFVQDIDARKPLSGREKELRKQQQDDSWTRGRAISELHATDNQYFNGPYAPSPPAPLPLSTVRRGASDDIFTPSSQEAEDKVTAFHASNFSMCGPMLTSQYEVEERLRKMNETFFKSLEIISNTQRRHAEKAKTSCAGTIDSSDGGGRTMHGRSTNSLATTARPLYAASGTKSRTSPRSPQSNQQYNTQEMGPGVGKDRNSSMSPSGLAHSDGGASQESQEVLGKMDRYEQRRLHGAYNG